jgi:hypothetical protein
MEPAEQPTLRSGRVRRWVGHLWREWTIESWRPIAPAFAKPEPLKWNDDKVTAATGIYDRSETIDRARAPIS